jgi:hypothetical protein
MPRSRCSLRTSCRWHTPRGLARPPRGHVLVANRRSRPAGQATRTGHRWRSRIAARVLGAACGITVRRAAPSRSCRRREHHRPTRRRAGNWPPLSKGGRPPRDCDDPADVDRLVSRLVDDANELDAEATPSAVGTTARSPTEPPCSRCSSTPSATSPAERPSRARRRPARFGGTFGDLVDKGIVRYV